MLKLNDKVKVVENYDIEQMRNKQGIIVKKSTICTYQKKRYSNN